MPPRTPPSPPNPSRRQSAPPIKKSFLQTPSGIVRPLRLAHVSDLHVGQDNDHDAAAASLARQLAESSADLVAVTGDVTNAGKVSEGRLFMKLFAPVLSRMVVVPGNHDRGFDNFASYITGRRSWTVDVPGVRFICLDSTLPGNEFMPVAWGDLLDEQVEFAGQAAKTTPRNMLPVVLLHHHVLPAEADSLFEAIIGHASLSFLKACDNGRHLLAAVGPDALILHGHKHRPSETGRVFNAGSTTELRQYREFEIRDGQVLSWSWVEVH